MHATLETHVLKKGVDHFNSGRICANRTFVSWTMTHGPLAIKFNIGTIINDTSFSCSYQRNQKLSILTLNVIKIRNVHAKKCVLYLIDQSTEFGAFGVLNAYGFILQAPYKYHTTDN